MSILPLSFSANKVGYKKYLKAGGGLLFADFVAYERRTAKEVLAEKINRFHSAMIYSYDQSAYYKSIGDMAMYELHTHTCEVRGKQLGEAHQELNLLEEQEKLDLIKPNNKAMKAIDELNKQIESNGCIHMIGNYFANVDKSTEKAMLIDIHGHKNWFPKSAFIMRDMGGIYCFGIKSFFADKFNGTR